MSTRYDEIHRYGTEVGLLDRSFARFGLLCCRLAAQGQITASDAEDVWRIFREARRAAGGKYTPSDAQTQQISKLRAIIKAGQNHGMGAYQMLERASQMFIQEFSNEKFDGQRPYSGEYDCLVHVARNAVKQGKALSASEVRTLMLK